MQMRWPRSGERANRKLISNYGEKAAHWLVNESRLPTCVPLSSCLAGKFRRYVFIPSTKQRCRGDHEVDVPLERKLLIFEKRKFKEKAASCSVVSRLWGSCEYRVVQDPFRLRRGRKSWRIVYSRVSLLWERASINCFPFLFLLFSFPVCFSWCRSNRSKAGKLFLRETFDSEIVSLCSSSRAYI